MRQLEGLESLRPCKVISFCAALRALGARSAARKVFWGRLRRPNPHRRV